MSSSTPVCSLATVNQQSNPDISGVGIRISFYLQNFILVLLVNRSWEDAPNSLWTFIATNFGLTIAALAQLDGDRLTLFEAVEVSYLVWLANFGTVLALASYSRQKSRNNFNNNEDHVSDHDNFVMVGAVIQTFLSMILTLTMWAGADQVGHFPEQHCNNQHLQFVFFFAKVPALTVGRPISLSFTTVIIFIYSSMTYAELKRSGRTKKTRQVIINVLTGRHWKEGLDKLSIPNQSSVVEMSHTIGRPGSSGSSSQRQRATAQATGTGNSLTVPSNSLRVPSAGSPLSGSPSNTEAFPSANYNRNHLSRFERSTKPTRRNGRREWVTLDGTLVGTLACQLAVFTYFIVCNELYINVYNKSDGESGQWGFGQVFALIVIIPSIVSVIRAFRKHGLSRLDRRDEQTATMVV